MSTGFKICTCFLGCWALLNNAAYSQGFFGLTVTEKNRDSLEAMLKTPVSDEVRFDAIVRLAAYHSFRTGSQDSVKAARYIAELKKIAESSGDSLMIAAYWTCEASYLVAAGYLRTPQNDSLSLKLVTAAERLYARMLERGELSAANLDEYMHVLNFCARVLGGMGRHEEAYPYIYRSLNMAKTRKKIHQELDASLELGNIHLNLMNYEEAASYYLRAAEIAKELKSQLAVTLDLNMGLVFVAQKNFDRGIVHLKRAFEQLEIRKNEFGVGDYRNGKAIYLNNLVSALLDMGRVAEAAEYNRLLSAWTDSLNNPLYKRYAEASDVVILLKENRLNAALEQERALLNRPGITPKILLRLNFAFADHYREVGLHNERIRRLKAIAFPTMEKTHAIKFYRALSDAYAKTGMPDSAFKYLNGYVELQEELNRAIQNRRTYELAFRFEVDKINEQLKLADKEIVLAKSRLNRQYFLTGAAVLASGIFIFMAWGYWKGRSKLTRALQKLREQNQDQRLSETINAKNDLDAFKESVLQLIVHDLKNPLNTVMGFSEIGEMDESVRMPIRAAGYRMLTLVNTMLDVSKLESAALVPVPKPLRVTDWVKAAFDQVRHDADNKQIRFLSDVRQDVWINADEDLAVRILVNLFSNAVKYCRTAGQISMSVGLHPDDKNRVKISVSDTGEGIAPEYLPMLFKRYSSDAPKALGLNRSTGLGLYFCKLAVEAHGGRIDAKSKPGYGTTISFDLPLSEVRENGDSAAQSPPGSVKPEIQAAQNLSNEEKQALKRHVQLLSELEVFETTNILALLESVPSESLTVKAWKKEVRKAVFACNAVRYAMLLRKAEP
jgi:signal transduction histidine kinase